MKLLFAVFVSVSSSDFFFSHFQRPNEGEKAALANSQANNKTASKQD